MSAVLPEIIGGKYRVTAQIGRGGMATVYAAVHQGTDRRVAVKVMTAAQIDPESSSSEERNGSLARFEREARIAGNIETQHVTRVYDTGIDPVWGPYIVMELLGGEDLKDLVRRLGPLRPDLSLRILAQACIGVGRAHALGVVHRDVKASNLFLAKDEFGKIVVKVLDFGIAKGHRTHTIDASDPKTLTETGAMLGSPHYMSPEQVLGSKTLDHRADIWSLGIVLYKCLSARTPFDDRDTVGHIVVSIVQGAPPSVQDFAPWVSPDIAEVLVKALRSRPQERYQTAEEMYEAIRALIPGDDVEITPEMLTPMTDDERRDVKPRLSMRVSIQETPAAGTLTKPARAPATTASGPTPPPASESDSTIGSSTSSLRRPSTGPHSSRSMIAGVGVAVALAGAVVWGLATHKSQVEAPPTAATAATVPSVAPSASPAPSSTGAWHVQVRVIPPNATVDVDDVNTVVSDGVVDVVGDLGSVHKVHLRGSGRETTVEVIVAEDGARPHTVALPDPRAGAAASPRKTGVASSPPAPAATQAPPAKSATRFDTRFE
ncbi:MAG TPA: serine/threonine-protein kinase [Polyangiaceae bacterium]|nr:serine/threonine-protein kinase [Polyangiaceae bacterium]